MVPVPRTVGSIDIEVEADMEDVIGTVTGSITTIVKNVADTLGLTKDSVLNAIRTRDKHREYIDFFFGNVKKTLTPVWDTAEVGYPRDEPVVVKTREFTNESYDDPSSHTAKLTHTTSNTVTVSSSSSEQTEKKFQIGFDVKISGSAGITFTNTLGESEQHTSTVVVSSEDSVTVNLRPRQSKKALLQVNRRVIPLKFKYRVTYSGHVVGTLSNYQNITYQLVDILDMLNKRKSYTVTETVELNYFTTGRVIVRDL